MSKNDFFDKNDYKKKKLKTVGLISQPNSGFWHYDSYYSIYENYKPQGEPKKAPLKCQKMTFLTKTTTKRKIIKNYGLFWPDISAQEWILTL